MPLYKITNRANGDTMLVKAVSAPAAMRHVAKALFECRTLESPVEVADLMESGIRLENADADDASPPSPEGAQGNLEQS